MKCHEIVTVRRRSKITGWNSDKDKQLLKIGGHAYASQKGLTSGVLVSFKTIHHTLLSIK